MKKLNNKGYMLVEIIMAFAITFGLIYFLMDLVINLKNKNDDLLVDTVIKTDQTIISNKLMDYIIADTSDEENITFRCDKIIVDEEKNTVIYDVNGDGIGGYDDSILGIVDDSATISYDFKDNCKNENGKIHINIPVEVKQMPDKNYNVVVDYRYMHLETYIVSYDANGGSGAPESQIKYEDIELTLHDDIPTLDGYSFVNWNTKADGSGKTYKPNGVYEDNNDIKLYAIWKINVSYCQPLQSYNCKDSSNRWINNSDENENYLFVYTGQCEVYDDGEENWRIKFLTSGTLYSKCETLVDVFLVGGGGGGGGGDGSGKEYGGGGGGGGGYTVTSIVKIDTRNEGYKIDIGAGGQGSLDSNGTNGVSTKAFGAIALGGDGGLASIGHAGGNGGNGGNGGGGGGYYEYDGGNGGFGGQNYGNGSDGDASRGGLTPGISTCEFNESSCKNDKLYAGGGGGSGGNEYSVAGNGGNGGGGRGQTPRGSNATSGKVNTGGGGGGGGKYGGTGMNGGSGIVVIRNSRKVSELPFEFDYVGKNAYYLYIVESDTNWKIKFLTSGTFIPKKGESIDAFLVGGGGGGGHGSSSYGGGGGGGGRINTSNNFNLVANNSYSIVVGEGGSGGTSISGGKKGDTTSAFGITALGGDGGTNGSSSRGGTGGSGGGGGGHGDYDDGGNGGFNGSNGFNGATSAGSGLGWRTFEFGANSGTLYSGGGGGGTGDTDNGALAGRGGNGGGGNGGNSCDASNGLANTGGGGGGASVGSSLIGGNGGSGIVVIRNTN